LEILINTFKSVALRSRPLSGIEPSMSGQLAFTHKETD